MATELLFGTIFVFLACGTVANTDAGDFVVSLGYKNETGHHQHVCTGVLAHIPGERKGMITLVLTTDICAAEVQKHSHQQAKFTKSLFGRSSIDIMDVFPFRDVQNGQETAQDLGIAVLADAVLKLSAFTLPNGTEEEAKMAAKVAFWNGKGAKIAVAVTGPRGKNDAYINVKDQRWLTPAHAYPNRGAPVYASDQNILLGLYSHSTSYNGDPCKSAYINVYNRRKMIDSIIRSRNLASPKVIQSLKKAVVNGPLVKKCSRGEKCTAA